MEHIGMYIFYGHFEYFKAMWYILWSFGVIFSVLVNCCNKNLAALVHSGQSAAIVASPQKQQRKGAA
jgi:hypothetical protein